MAKSLQGEVLLNKKVKKLAEDKYLVKVECEDGSVYQADKLICTIPFSVLRGLEIQAGFSSAQKEAIDQLAYTQITIAVVAVKNKFWEADGLPVSMWSNSPIERVFAANDLEADEVLLKAFINGKAAMEADKLSKQELSNLVKKTFENIRPSTQNNIELMDTFSWGNYEFNKGAYAEFQAGQVQKFVPAMALPTSRIFLAGEHTSFEDRGMEGALASADRAVKEMSIPVKG